MKTAEAWKTELTQRSGFFAETFTVPVTVHDIREIQADVMRSIAETIEDSAGAACFRAVTRFAVMRATALHKEAEKLTDS